MSIDESSPSYSEGTSQPAKRRRVVDTTENLSFKDKVQSILDNLTIDAPGEFAVFGKLNAPMVTIAIKVISTLIFCLERNVAIQQQIIIFTERQDYSLSFVRK